MATKGQAETEFFASYAARARAETREATARAKIAELELERDQQKRQDELAADAHHKVYVFNSKVEEASVSKCTDKLVAWSRQQPGCDIEIQVDSPGGEIFSGFKLIDFVRDLRTKGHKITMVTFGMAASMAGVILQAADTRVMGDNAFMLIHEGSLGAIGDFGDVEDRVELMGLMHERILGLFEDRAKEINPKTTKNFIRKRWKRKDWWVPAEECLRLGLVDEVR